MPAFAVKSLTVDQFDQWLAAEHGKSGSKVTRQISKFELSERVSRTRLAQWETEFPDARDELIAIADASQFLPPAASDVIKDPVPDVDTQKKMLSTATRYVDQTMSRLPDFIATRETKHYQGGEVLAGEPLHFIGDSSMTVTYRDGREVRDDQTRAREPQGPPGLTSTGEFGPILSIVLGDAEHGQVHWGYWERSANPVAVFLYSVPVTESHYTVTFPDVRQTVTLSPGYHGEIALDPESGEILRLTLISDLPPRYKQASAAMMVAYAPVAIGSRTYICPVQGVALSRFQVSGTLTLSRIPVIVPSTEQTELNDVSFTHYHLFRADTKILP